MMGSLELLLSLLLMSFLGVTPLLSADPAALEIADQAFSRMNSFKGTFVQTYYDSLQDRTDVSKGTVSFLKPGRMKWTYLDPEPMTVIIGSEKIWIVDPLLENVTVQDIQQVSRIDSLAFLLRHEAMAKHFKTITPRLDYLKTSQELLALYLAPKEENPDFREIQIGLEQGDHQLKQFVIIDHMDNRRNIQFSEMVLNPSLDATQFEFQIPEGMEVIDGMY